MQRAVSLLRGTSPFVEQIAAMLGYTNTGNFYKAFKRYCLRSPRQYAKAEAKAPPEHKQARRGKKRRRKSRRRVRPQGGRHEKSKCKGKEK